MPAPIVKDLKGPIATRLCATWSFAPTGPIFNLWGFPYQNGVRSVQQGACRQRVPSRFEFVSQEGISSLVAKSASNRLNGYALKCSAARLILRG